MYETLPEGVSLNPDSSMVQRLRAVMEKNGGYCPCRLQHTPDTLCPCLEFRGQVADPAFSGFCHCHLYYKEPPKETQP